jgi:hypothetical protein
LKQHPGSVTLPACGPELKRAVDPAHVEHRNEQAGAERGLVVREPKRRECARRLLSIEYAIAARCREVGTDAREC